MFHGDRGGEDAGKSEEVDLADGNLTRNSAKPLWVMEKKIIELLRFGANATKSPSLIYISKFD